MNTNKYTKVVLVESSVVRGGIFRDGNQIDTWISIRSVRLMFSSHAACLGDRLDRAHKRADDSIEILQTKETQIS